jgi:hypothetical protein
MELDVLAIRSEGGVQTIYACEVVTHLDGMLYPGTPETDRWSEFGNDDYQYTYSESTRSSNPPSST